ncbi:hypothetical protein IWX81_000230 [Salinibacterium sp. CAN_S4]|uniref:SCO7613 C-terminal domain-containing membrane protein n=1 Tax=Salinibacterium sp. CAN_S4 TaxID=2787727 RepID=UPI0018EFA6A2
MSTFLPYVGFVQFPRNPRDLSNQVCPACLVDRDGLACGTCGLDLQSPLIARLDSESKDAAAALDRRLELIGQIRFDSAAVEAEQQSVISAPVLAAMAPPTIADPEPEVVTDVAPAPPQPPATQPVAPRRHVGVQVILLITGVSLLSIGAIFFLVYAFINFGLVWRTVIILAVTAAAIAGASILRSRNLRVTAEGIAALAVVFVYLDIYAIKANDFFGAGAVRDPVYWGIALLLSAVAFTAWHRLSGLRLPSVVASIALAPGAALLIGGAFDAVDVSITLFAAFIGLAVAGLAHAAFRHRAEKSIVAGFGVLGLILAAGTSPFISGDFVAAGQAAPAVAQTCVALVALAQVWLVVRLGSPLVPARLAAVIGAASLTSATFVVATRSPDAGFAAFWPVVAAAIVALGLEFLSRATRVGLAAQFSGIAAKTAAAIGILILLPPITYAVTPAAVVVAAASPPWTVAGGSLLLFGAGNAAAILALLVVVVLVGAAWAIAGTLDERLLIVMAAGFATLLLAVPLVGVLWATVAAWLLLAAAGLVALRIAHRLGWSTGIRITIAAGSLVAMTLAYLSSWASIDTWWYGSLGVIALLIAARVATKQAVTRAATLGLAIVLSFIAIGAEGFHVNERFAGGADSALESTLFIGILAVLLLAASAVLSRRLSALEARVLFWLSLTSSVGVGAVLWFVAASRDTFAGLVLPFPPITLALSAALVVGFALWAEIAPSARFRAERIAASVLIAPAAAWALDSLARATSLPSFAAAVAPITAALIVSAVALALDLRGRGARVPLEIGVGIVAVASVIFSAPLVIYPVPSDSLWLVLELAGVAALLLAISRDGLFSSASPRKYIGWLALVLAVAGLWWALGDAGVEPVEPFALPLAGALLLIALLDWRSADRRNESSAAAPYIFLAALLVAILPIAVVAMTGPTVRTVIITASCAAVLMAASLDSRPAGLRPYLDAAAAASAAGLLVAGFGRPLVISMVPLREDAQLDIWTAATFIVLVAAVVIQSRITHPETRRRRIEAAVVVLVAALVGIVVIELSVIQDTALGAVRAGILLVLLAGISVGSQLVDRAPFTRIVGWIAFGGAVVVAITTTVIGAIDPFEWATGTLAVALLAVGTVRLRRDPQAGSWPWLAPGILVLLVPSLFATFTDAPIWRLVALGAACVILIVVGAVGQLQAPLVLGSVVVLIHAIRTFAPQLVAVYQLTEWWVWAVIGGAIILFVAITLEKRVRDLKSVGGRISALR